MYSTISTIGLWHPSKENCLFIARPCAQWRHVCVTWLQKPIQSHTYMLFVFGVVCQHCWQRPVSRPCMMRLEQNYSWHLRSDRLPLDWPCKSMACNINSRLSVFAFITAQSFASSVAATLSISTHPTSIAFNLLINYPQPGACMTV